MSKYISLDWLVDYYFDRDVDYYGKYVREDFLSEDTPIFEVVRCKDCKRANYEMSGVYCGLSDVNMGEDGFCSYGERKDNE